MIPWSNDFDKEFLDKIKELNKEEWYEELFPKSNNIDLGEKIIQYVTDKINFLKTHEDAKKRYDLSKKLFEKLEKEKPYLDHIFEKHMDDGYEEMQRLEGGSKKIMNDFKNVNNINDNVERMEILCRMYAYQYERACNMFFKPIVEKITSKKIQQCYNCINVIRKYEPDMEFILKYFLNKIRNSINHNGYYFDKEKNKVIFKDNDDMIELTLEELENGCRMQIVNQVCMSTAEESMKIQILKVGQYDMKKIQKYCNILKIDYDKLLKYSYARGYSVFEICWRLEQKMKYHL